MLVGEGVGKFLRLQFKHRFFENFLIRLIAEVGNKAALLGPEQVSGAADVEVLHGDMYAAAEVGEALNGLQTTFGFRCK